MVSHLLDPFLPIFRHTHETPSKKQARHSLDTSCATSEELSSFYNWGVTRKEAY
jgi:hypothetical protein